MKLVCKESPKEYLQPFKDKLEDFFQRGRRLSQLHIKVTQEPSWQHSLWGSHCYLIPDGHRQHHWVHGPSSRGGSILNVDGVALHLCLTFWDHFTLSVIHCHSCFWNILKANFSVTSRAEVSLLPVIWSQCGRARLTHRWPGSTLTDHSVDVQALRSPAAHSDLWSALRSQQGIYSWSHEGGNLETWNLLFVVIIFSFPLQRGKLGPHECHHPTAQHPLALWHTQEMQHLLRNLCLFCAFLHIFGRTRKLLLIAIRGQGNTMLLRISCFNFLNSV